MRLEIELAGHGEVPEGHVTFESAGRQQPFRGWLELAALIQAASRADTSAESLPKRIVGGGGTDDKGAN
jgi:hypothetical protein